WTLNIDDEGHATLTIHKRADDIRKPFIVDLDDLTKLKRVLAAEEFFTLPAKIGDIVPGESVRALKIAVDSKQKEITWGSTKPSESTVTWRAMRVWQEICKLFDDDD